MDDHVPPRKARELLASSETICAELDRLNAVWPAEITVAFDATDYGYIGKGWPTTYVVINLSVSLSPGATGIPDDLYRRCLDLFRTIDGQLRRQRSFFHVNVNTSVPGYVPYSLGILLENRQLGTTAASDLYDVGNLIVHLAIVNKDFNAMYDNERYALVTHSSGLRRNLAVPLDATPAFDRHFALGGLCHDVIIDTYSEGVIAIAAMFWGNVLFFAGRYREAIDQWSAVDDAMAQFNIACAYTRLGEIKSSCRHCVAAIKAGIDHHMVLNDPDLAPLRESPLFSEVRRLL